MNFLFFQKPISVQKIERFVDLNFFFSFNSDRNRVIFGAVPFKMKGFFTHDETYFVNTVDSCLPNNKA